MAKKIKAVVKLHIKAGKATPAPPIGPALAQHGLNIGEFCKQFNDASRQQEGFTLPTVITIYEDRGFDFKMKAPVTSQLIKKEIGIEKGSGEPNKKKVGKITQAQLEKVARQKMQDLNTTDIEQAKKVVAGTAKSMGLEVK
ncbi:MAG: 50S ribosomal protein L11 [Candidatus Pacebacteria bacterium]|nr:50S ribosomal protein L11 [Candidatus Paceibacterota bacterium]